MPLSQLIKHLAVAAIASTYPSKVNSACCFLIQYILIRSINELEAYYLTDETPLSLLIKLLATKKHSIYIYYYILYIIIIILLEHRMYACGLEHITL